MRGSGREEEGKSKDGEDDAARKEEEIMRGRRGMCDLWQEGERRRRIEGRENEKASERARGRDVDELNRSE